MTKKQDFGQEPGGVGGGCRARGQLATGQGVLNVYIYIYIYISIYIYVGNSYQGLYITRLYILSNCDRVGAVPNQGLPALRCLKAP